MKKLQKVRITTMVVPNEGHIIASELIYPYAGSLNKMFMKYKHTIRLPSGILIKEIRDFELQFLEEE